MPKRWCIQTTDPAYPGGHPQLAQVAIQQHPNKVYSRIDLMEQVWNYGYVGDDQRTVDVTVRRLREKIETNPANPKYILTRRGVGYYFAV